MSSFAWTKTEGFFVILLFYWSLRLEQLLVLWFFEKCYAILALNAIEQNRTQKDCRKRVNATIALEMPVKCFFMVSNENYFMTLKGLRMQLILKGDKHCTR